MKLPTTVVTKHKIRDFKICSLYAQDALTYADIATRFGITATRVGQILYKNKHLLKIDREHEKVKRVNTLKRILAKKSEDCPSKDKIDVMEKLRDECEGTGSEALGRADTRIIIIRADANHSVQEITPNIGNMSIIRPSVAQAIQDEQCQKLS